MRPAGETFTVKLCPSPARVRDRPEAYGYSPPPIIALADTLAVLASISRVAVIARDAEQGTSRHDPNLDQSLSLISPNGFIGWKTATEPCEMLKWAYSKVSRCRRSQRGMRQLYLIWCSAKRCSLKSTSNFVGHRWNRPVSNMFGRSKNG